MKNGASSIKHNRTMKTSFVMAAIALQLALVGCVTHGIQASYPAVPVNQNDVMENPLVELKTLPYEGVLYAAKLAPTGSMRPTLNDHDLILYTKMAAFESIQTGDIVLFRNPDSCSKKDSLVCHRVVYRTGSFLRTKGDNNPANDPFLVKKEFFYGKLVGVIRSDDVDHPVVLAANDR